MRQETFVRWALVVIGLPAVLMAAVIKHTVSEDRPPATVVALFRAHGNEPFWNVDIAGNTITFKTAEGDTVVASPMYDETVEGGRRLSGGGGGPALAVTLVERGCVDSMSGLPFTHTVSVQVGGREYRGCGGPSKAAAERTPAQ